MITWKVHWTGRPCHLECFTLHTLIPDPLTSANLLMRSSYTFRMWSLLCTMVTDGTPVSSGYSLGTSWLRKS